MLSINSNIWIKNYIVHIILLSLFLFVYSIKSYAGQCIAADDFGLGASLSVKANPSESNLALIESTPKKSQIAPWIKTGFNTLGNPPNPSNPEENSLRISVRGKWNPWGAAFINSPQCRMKPCSTCPSPGNNICIPGDCQTVDDSDPSLLPCYLSEAWGLYGLIAIQGPDGKTQDPNNIAFAKSLPTAYFRTFRVAPVVKSDKISSAEEDETTGPEYQYSFSLKSTKVCEENQSSCKTDVHSEGGEYVVRGELFFKIIDNYYEDNSGEYDINILGGIYKKKGFIEYILDVFEKQIDNVVQSMIKSVASDAGFINIVRSILILYVAVSGFLYAIGMIKSSQKEFVIRLFKFSLVAGIISDPTLEFFNVYLFSLCREGARSIGDIIINATLYYNGDKSAPIYYMPSNSSFLSVYDVLLDIITSRALNCKIASLLFYKWMLYWIPCIYIGIFYVLLAILKTLMLYLLMIIQIALLMIVAPIFIIMMLFKITNQLFQSWLQQLISTGILYIMMAVTVGLMMKLIMGQIQSLLFFKVCEDTIWKLEILGLTLFKLDFWNPQSSSELMNSLNPENILAFILMSVIFIALMGKIPSMVDIIGGSTRGSLQTMYEGALSNYNQSVINKGISTIKSATEKYVTAKAGKALEKALDKGLDKISKYDGGVTKGVVNYLVRKPISVVRTVASTAVNTVKTVVDSMEEKR